MEQPKQKLYKKLSEEGKYTKSYPEFEKQFSDPAVQEKLFTSLSNDGLYTKTKEEFKSQFFSDNVIPLKKKEQTEVDMASNSGGGSLGVSEGKKDKSPKSNVLEIAQLQKKLKNIKVTPSNMDEVDNDTNRLSQLLKEKEPQQQDIKKKNDLLKEPDFYNKYRAFQQSTIFNPDNDVHSDVARATKKLNDEIDTNSLMDNVFEITKKAGALAGSFINEVAIKPINQAVTVFGKTTREDIDNNKGILPQFEDTYKKEIPLQKQLQEDKKIRIEEQKQALKNKKEIPTYTKEDILERAKKMFIDEEIESYVYSRKKDYLQELQDDDDGVLQSKFADFEKGELASFEEKDRVLLTQQAVQEGVYKRSLAKKENLEEEIKKQGLTPKLKQEYQDNLLEIKEVQSDGLATINKYVSNRKNIGNATDNLDVFKRNYSVLGNLVGNVGVAGMQLVSGAFGALDYGADAISLATGLKSSGAFKEISKSIDDVSKSTADTLEQPMSVDNINSLSDLGDWLMNDVTAKQIPIFSMLAFGVGGVVALGATSGGTKFEDMKGEVERGEKKYSTSEMLSHPLGYAIAETGSAAVDLMILRNAGRVVASATAPERRMIAQGMVKGLKKYAGVPLQAGVTEFVDETTTQGIENIIDGKPFTEGMKDAGAAGFAMGFAIPFIASNYKATIKPFTTDTKIQEESARFMNFQQQLTNPELSAETRAITQESLDKSKIKVESLIKKAIGNIKSLSNEQFQEIVRLENAQSNIKSKASQIRIDENLNDDIREQIIKNLQDEFNANEKRRLDLLERGASVQLERLDDKEQIRLKDLAGRELMQEQNPDGTASITLNDNEISKRAIDIYKKEIASRTAQNQSTSTSEATSVADPNNITPITPQPTNAETETPITDTKSEAEVQQQANATEEIKPAPIVVEQTTTDTKWQSNEIDTNVYESKITISDAVADNDGIFLHKGQKGEIKLEGQTVVFETKDKIIELGNKDEIADLGLENFGIEQEQEIDLTLNDDNSVTIDGKTYFNNYSNQDSAISQDKDGNYSVTLETENGQKRTFRGQRADQIVYQIKLKNFEQNATAEQIETGHQIADEVIRIETENTATTVERKDKVVEQAKPVVVPKKEAIKPEVSDTETKAETPTPKGDTSNVGVEDQTPILKEEHKIENKIENKSFSDRDVEVDKEKNAKGFVSLSLKKLTTSLKDFQGRAKEYSQQTYDRIVNEAKNGTLNLSAIPPIQIWKDPKTNNFIILAGHSRTKAFTDLANGNVEFSEKYTKSDFENINSQIVEAETLQEAQKIAQESNQGAVQTVVDNAKYVRESLLPTFANYNQAKNKLKDLYGAAWTRIYAYAHLNPNGKSMSMLNQFRDSNEGFSDDISKKIAEWAGKARAEFKNLTNAHEDEIFEYLLKNDKIKTYQEFSQLLNNRVNGIQEFNQNEPLNFENKVGRGSNEVEIVKQIQDLKTRENQIKNRITELQKFGKNLNETQRKEIKDLTAEVIKINTVDIPNAQVKQKEAREADSNQFDIFSQINEEIQNGNITAEQVDEFVENDRKAEEIEPIVKVVESKAESNNKTELKEVIEEVDSIVKPNFEPTNAGESRVSEQENTPSPVESVKKESNAGVEVTIKEIFNQDNIKDDLDWLDSLKLDPSNLSATLPFLPQVFNALIDAIKVARMAGNSLSKAIEIARQKLSDKFDAKDIDNAINAFAQKANIVVESPKLQSDTKKTNKSNNTETGKNEQAFSARAFNSENLNQKAKDKLQALGLEYKIENQEIAQKNAEKIIAEIGILDAYNLAKAGQIRGGAKTWIMAQMFEDLNTQIDQADRNNDTELADSLSTELAEIIKYFADEKTLAGQEAAMLNRIYNRFGMKYDVGFAREKWQKQYGEDIPVEVEARLVNLEKQLKQFEADKKTLEEKIGNLEEQEAISNLQNQVKKSRTQKPSASSLTKAASALRQVKFTKLISDLSTLQSNPLVLVTTIFDGAVETIAKALDAGATIEQAVKKGIIEIKNSDWYKGLSSASKINAEKIANKQFTDFIQQEISKPKNENLLGVQIPYDLLYNLVKDGVDNIQDLTEAVHKVLLEEYPNITNREVRDAITGYGKTINETKDDIKKEISRLRTDGKQMSALDDLADGKLPKRSGRKPKNYTPEQRNRIKQIRELIKNIPINDDTDKAEYYKTALEAYKTRVENRIKDLNEALTKNERIINEKRNTILDQEAEDLVKKRDALQKEYDQYFGKPYKSDETLINEIVKTKEKSLRDLEVKLETVVQTGKELPAKEKRIVSDPKIDKLTKEIESKRNELNDALEQVGIAESKRLKKAINYSKKRLNELNTKIAKGDFTRPTPRKIKYNDELIKLKGEIIIAKTKWDIEFEKAEFKKLGFGEKIIEYVYRTFGTAKGLKATADLSAMLRQGILLGTRNPKEFAIATAEMHKFVYSEVIYKKWMTDLETSKDYVYMVEDGLSITDTSGDVLKAEERFVGSLLNKKIMINNFNINIVGRIQEGSERAYGGFLNSLRVSMYRKIVAQYEMMGITREAHPKKYKSIAKFINNATGRGVMTSDKRIAKLLNIAFFSPRMITGMAGVFKDLVRTESTPYLRKQAATTLLTFVGYQFAMKFMIAQALMLLSPDDDDEEITQDMNPVSTDFNKVKKGNTRYDVSAGYSIAARTAARFFLNKKSSGIDYEEKNFDDQYKENAFSEVGSFFINKLSPLSAQIYKYKTNEHPTEFYGNIEDATVTDYLSAFFVPISIANFIDDIENETPKNKLFFDLILNTYGISVQKYGDKNKE